MSEVRGTYLPTIIGNGTLESSPPAGRYPNYVSGGLTAPTYGYQYGNWVSTPVNVDGNTLYEVKVNVSISVSAWNGFFTELANVVIYLPFTNYYDNEMCLVNYSNSGGQITPRGYSNSGTNYVVGQNNAVWNPNPSDVYTISFTYFTLTPP